MSRNGALSCSSIPGSGVLMWCLACYFLLPEASQPAAGQAVESLRCRKRTASCGESNRLIQWRAGVAIGNIVEEHAN